MANALVRLAAAAACSAVWFQAQAEPVLAGLLESPGQTADIRAGGSRVIAYFDWADAVFDVTLLLSGPVFGSEVIRSSLSLADGQRHTLTLHGGRERDRVIFLRRGDSLIIATETTGRSVALAE